MVNLADLLIITKIAFGFSTANASQQLHGDVGPQVAGVPLPDGQINIADIMLVQRKLFGFISF